MPERELGQLMHEADGKACRAVAGDILAAGEWRTALPALCAWDILPEYERERYRLLEKYFLEKVYLIQGRLKPGDVAGVKEFDLVPRA